MPAFGSTDPDAGLLVPDTSGHGHCSMVCRRKFRMSTTGKAKANDTGDRASNKEMNPAANSSVTEDGLLEDENTESAGGDWRGEEEDEITSDSTEARRRD